MPKSGKQAEELVAITKAYDLVRELTQRVGKFPRDHKFLLGDRILTNAYDVLDMLIEAEYSRNKVPLLDRANIRLEQMRFQVRLAHDEKLISTHQYEVASRLVKQQQRPRQPEQQQRFSGGQHYPLPESRPPRWAGACRESPDQVLAARPNIEPAWGGW
jgi:hypothetical protein